MTIIALQHLVSSLLNLWSNDFFHLIDANSPFNLQIVIIAIVESLGLSSLVYQCTDTIGTAAPSTSHSAITGLFYHYLEDWDGEPIFEETTYSDIDNSNLECITETELEVDSCSGNDCAWGMTNVWYPTLLDATTGLVEYNDPEDFDYCFYSGSNSSDMNCTRCDSVCDIACPLPFIYTDHQYTSLWVTTWLPGFIGLPLSISVVLNERKRVLHLKRRDFTDWIVCVSAIICIMLFFLDSLPSAILAEDMRCNGYDVLDFRVNSYGNSYCEFGKIKPHLLQALLLCVAITLYKVYRQIKASRAMSRYIPSRGFIIFSRLGLILIPGLLSLGTFLLEADQLYMTSYNYRIAQGGSYFEELMYFPNLIRYAYSCGPLFESELEEWIFVQGPLLLIGLSCVLLSFLLLHNVMAMGGFTISSRGKGTTAPTNKAKTNSLYALAINMLIFAGFSTMLVLINAIATFSFLPNAKSFGVEVDMWVRCARTGIDWKTAVAENATDVSNYVSTNKTKAGVIAHCGALEDHAPDFSLIILQAVAQSLPPLCFGFIFALPVIKQIAKCKFNKIFPKVEATSAAPTTTTSHNHSISMD